MATVGRIREGHVTGLPTEKPFTVMVCSGCPTESGQTSPVEVLDAVGSAVRECHHGVLISVPCLLGQPFCTERPGGGVLAAVQSPESPSSSEPTLAAGSGSSATSATSAGASTSGATSSTTTGAASSAGAGTSTTGVAASSAGASVNAGGATSTGAASLAASASATGGGAGGVTTSSSPRN